MVWILLAATTTTPLAAAIPPVGHHARSDPGLARSMSPSLPGRVLVDVYSVPPGADRGPRAMRMPEHWERERGGLACRLAGVRGEILLLSVPM